MTTLTSSCMRFLVLSLFFAGSAVVFGQSSETFDRLLIETPKPYTKMVSLIQALGGKVTHQYEHFDLIAAEIPSDAVESFRAIAVSAIVYKDLTVPMPKAAGTGRAGTNTSDTTRNVRVSSTARISDVPAAADVTPGAYALNNFGLNVGELHAAGFTGQGAIVAVIDSGIRPGYMHLESDKSVIGGIDFVGDGNGFSNPGNNPHGTFVAGMISANVSIDLRKSALLESLRVHAPGALAGISLPLIGTAPEASIYAVRVFGDAGAPESVVIRAIDHIIDLKKRYKDGRPGGLNIQVCNLSLGNTTTAAGRDVFDRRIDDLLANDIVPVVSGGNVGPSALTIASPATANAGISVGAANPAASERIFRDVQDNSVGYGVQFRPSDANQIAWFSSRGPNADGRIDPDVVANGFANFGQGYGSPKDVSIAGGTSFSAPLVAGMAAILRQAHPTATATQVRNAIVASARTGLVPYSTALDQGAGYPDAVKAFGLIESISGSLPPLSEPQKSVAVNVKQGANLQLIDGLFSKTFTDIQPGQREEILYRVAPNTKEVFISLKDIQSGAQQNAIFGNDILLSVHSAKTSAIRQSGDYLIDEFTMGQTAIVRSIKDPETGILRVTVSGSWTNAGPITATLAISATQEPVPVFTTQGQLSNRQRITVPISIPSGTMKAEFRLWFREDWSNYPASDIDMYLFDPNLKLYLDGAQLNDPELAVISRPAPGVWYVVIDGFSIPAGWDQYELRVTIDGKVVK